MPAATTSRRRIARRQNSEEIEDARSSQAKRPNDDVSDDDQPAVKVKKEKKGKKKAAPNDEDDEAPVPALDDEDDEDDRIDAANFPDQPLPRGDSTKVKGMSDDWESMARQIGQQFSIYKDVAVAMAESGEKDLASSEDLRDLDRDMREFLDVSSEMELQAQAVRAIQQSIAQGDNVVNPPAIYEENLRQLMDEYAGKTSRQKYLKDKRYVEFHNAIWLVHHPDEPMPPLTDFIPKEDGDEDDDEDDVEMGGVTQKYTCPLSLTTLVKPVKSQICGHSFSEASIEEYCRIPGRPYKCPYSGCNKSFRNGDWDRDTDLEDKVRAYLRSVARNTAQDSDADSDDVVD